MKSLSKTIETKNINILMAIIAIGIKTKPTTMAKVLSEIISLSENAQITNVEPLSKYVTKKLGISHEVYRASLHKLYKMKLLVKTGGVLYLAPVIKTPFNEVKIVRK